MGDNKITSFEAAAGQGDPSDIVGHKTMAGGSHQPLTRAEGEALWASAVARQEKRATDMPTEESAISVLFEAYQRLRELGWKEAIYCPKDGTPFMVIEPGSTGIFRAHYSGEWPKGTWWAEDGGDLWPSRPCLFKLYPEDQAKEEARLEAARAKYALENQS